MRYVPGLIAGSDLLDWATGIVGRGSGAVEVDRRRAISAAYYGLFHTLIWAAASVIVGDDSTSRAGIVRTYEPATMKKVCEPLARYPRNREQHWTSFLSPPPHTLLISVAVDFMAIQRAREEADYNLNNEILLTYARERVELARTAANNFAKVRELPEARLFLAALLTGDRWIRRG